MKKQKIIKIIKYFGISILTLFIIFLLVVNITPNFISKIVRIEFDKSISTKPKDYDMYKEKVNKISNLTYPSKYKDNNFDLYLPKEGSNHSIIIWIHGGSFVGGDKSDVEEYATLLASSGYAVLSFNYERAPELKYPNQLHQLEEIYIHTVNIKDLYSLNINELYLAGDSAGAHLVSQFTLIQTSKEYRDIMNFNQTVEENGIKGLLLYCGPYNVKKLNNIKNNLTSFFISQTSWAYFGTRNWEEKYGEIATIKNHITENFPKTFITDGNTNSFEDHAKELAQELENKEVEVTTYFIPKETITNHEYQFKLDTEHGFESYKETIKFLKNNKGEEYMEEKICQSCSMPLLNIKEYGTNEDNSKS